MTIAIADTTATRRAFGVALIANVVWINLSEVFRYFVFIMPMMRNSLPEIPDVAPMNLQVFLIWGVWDTVLVLATTGFAWLMLERFGTSAAVTIGTGTAIWAAIFLILWLGMWNMNLASLPIIAVALPLAWVEMVVATAIVRWAMQRA